MKLVKNKITSHNNRIQHMEDSISDIEDKTLSITKNDVTKIGKQMGENVILAIDNSKKKCDNRNTRRRGK